MLSGAELVQTRRHRFAEALLFRGKQRAERGDIVLFGLIVRERVEAAERGEAHAALVFHGARDFDESRLACAVEMRRAAGAPARAGRPAAIP